MSKNNINQKRFLKRVAKKMLSATGIVEPIKEYQAIYPTASHDTARANAPEIMNSELGKKTLAEYLAVDYPKNKRSKRLTELATAEKDHVLQDGTIVPIRDNQSSLRALELMAKLDGETNDTGMTKIDARSIHYHITPDEATKLSALADKLDLLEADDKPVNSMDKTD